MPRCRIVFDAKGRLAEYENGELVWLREDYVAPARSELAAPTVISDHHVPFRSMADGRMYDSKSAYRRTLRDRGLVEVGNDTSHMAKPWGKTGASEDRRRLLHKQLADVSDREANKVLKQLKKAHSP